METFGIGELAHYSIRGDSYPVRVIDVTPSGKTLTVISVRWKAKPDSNRFVGDGFRQDEVFDITDDTEDPPRKFRYSQKRQAHMNGKSFSLGKGFYARRDPQV